MSLASTGWRQGLLNCSIDAARCSRVEWNGHRITFCAPRFRIPGARPISVRRCLSFRRRHPKPVTAQSLGIRVLGCAFIGGTESGVHSGRAQPRHTDAKAQASNSRPACNSGDVQISLLDSLCCKMAAVHGQLSARSEGGFSDKSHTAAAASRPRQIVTTGPASVDPSLGV